MTCDKCEVYRSDRQKRHCLSVGAPACGLSRHAYSKKLKSLSPLACWYPQV
ncbi:hypothetical protein [Dyadobacter helix]